MKLLFVYTSLPKGGIETFFVRISKVLSQEDVEINFLFFGNVFNEELILELKKYARVFEIKNYIVGPTILKVGNPLLKLFLPLKRSKLEDEILKGVDHIHAPDFNSILYAYRILNGQNISISTGVYHINEYNFGSWKNWYFAKKIKNFLKILPSKNILFFNEISKEFYNELFDGKFFDSTVTPIGIDLSKFDKKSFALKNNKIVSVGRLAQWKKYNTHIIEAIYSLKKQNLLFFYDSYGEGDQLDILEAKVKKYGLTDLITFHKGIEYSNFQETIKDKLMFIGAGTALIEASACGIPSLIGIENEELPVTYGFLHDLNTYSYQEIQLNYERIMIEKFILKLINMTDNDYDFECLKAQNRAKDFSIDITKKDFQHLISNPLKFKFKLSYLQIIFILISMAVNKTFFANSNYSKRL